MIVRTSVADAPTTFRITSSKEGHEIVIRVVTKDSECVIGRLNLIFVAAAGEPALEAFLRAMTEGAADALAGGPTGPATVFRPEDGN